MTVDERQPDRETIPAEPEGTPATRKSGRGKSQEEKRSHKGVTIEFRVFPEEAAALKERAAEASMTVSEFCRRASSGKRIVSRYDYDVIRRLAELHGDQARLGNLFKMALAGELDQIDKSALRSVMGKIAKNQELITHILTEVDEA